MKNKKFIFLDVHLIVLIIKLFILFNFCWTLICSFYLFAFVEGAVFFFFLLSVLFFVSKFLFRNLNNLTPEKEIYGKHSKCEHVQILWLWKYV